MVAPMPEGEKIGIIIWVTNMYCRKNIGLSTWVSENETIY